MDYDPRSNLHQHVHLLTQLIILLKINLIHLFDTFKYDHHYHIDAIRLDEEDCRLLKSLRLERFPSVFKSKLRTNLKMLFELLWHPLIFLSISLNWNIKTLQFFSSIKGSTSPYFLVRKCTWERKS